MIKMLFLGILVISYAFADALDDELSGFDDEMEITEMVQEEEERTFLHEYGLSAKLTQQFAKYGSSKSSVFVDFDKKFDDIRIKINAKSDLYTNNKIDSLKRENEIYDAFIQTKLSDQLDLKIGRQVVVWGRSDTIRITDVINPLDNRRPAMVDIEDLRLPVTMAKFDYYLGEFQISLINILEQRFNRNPSLGSIYYPFSVSMPSDKNYHDITMALSLSADFSSWDISLYLSRLRDTNGYISQNFLKHNKVDMFGAAVNVLEGVFLFKGEFAYLASLKFSQTGEKKFERFDSLLGLEYNGIADTLISFDTSLRAFQNYDSALSQGYFRMLEHTYQHAFRISSDFYNATLNANYLISLYGDKMDEGGFQRVWVKYDFSDTLYTTVGIVDYIGGNTQFESLKKNDMAFFELTYSF